MGFATHGAHILTKIIYMHIRKIKVFLFCLFFLKKALKANLGYITNSRSAWAIGYLIFKECMLLISALERQGQADFCELNTSLVF